MKYVKWFQLAFCVGVTGVSFYAGYPFTGAFGSLVSLWAYADVLKHTPKLGEP